MCACPCVYLQLLGERALKKLTHSENSGLVQQPIHPTFWFWSLEVMIGRLHRSGTPLKELTHRYSRVIFNPATPYRHLEQGSYSRSLKLRMLSKEKSQPKLAAPFGESQSITANAFCPTSLVWPLGIWQMLIHQSSDLNTSTPTHAETFRWPFK